MDLRLRPMRPTDETEARAAQVELAPDGFGFLLFWEETSSWPDYLAALEDTRRGVAVPAGMVPATFLVAEVDGELVGRTSIRHELNDWLARIGGSARTIERCGGALERVVEAEDGAPKRRYWIA